MKRTTSIVLLALLVLVSLPASAAQIDGATSLASKKKTLHIAGTVGSEGKTLVGEGNNRIWNVVNPEALRASEGRRVTVRAYTAVNSSEINVTEVRLREERTTAKLDDAAFRR